MQQFVLNCCILIYTLYIGANKKYLTGKIKKFFDLLPAFYYLVPVCDWIWLFCLPGYL